MRNPLCSALLSLKHRAGAVIGFVALIDRLLGVGNGADFVHSEARLDGERKRVGVVGVEFPDLLPNPFQDLPGRPRIAENHIT